MVHNYLAMKDHYRTLGVDRSAAPDEIKRAYRKLASQHHPDKGGDTQKFQEIEEAYRVLGDPDSRAQYDNPMPGNQFNFTGNGPFDFQSIFDVFGAKFNMHQQRPRYARMSLWISLQDVITGGPRQVAVGTQQGTQTVEIDIPRGIDDGATIQYQGIAPGGGDLVVTYRIHPDSRWQRQGPNLYTELTVTMWDLILGSELPVQDVMGTQLILTIPPRTQPGTMLRLRGRGLPVRGSTNTGDAFFRVGARLPDNISSNLTDAIRQERGH